MTLEALTPPILVRRGSDSIWSLTKLGAGEGGISSFLSKWRASVRTDTYNAMIDALSSGDRDMALGFFRGLAAISDGGIPFPDDDVTENT